MANVPIAVPVQYFCVKLLCVRKSTNNGLSYSDYYISPEKVDALWNTKHQLKNGRHYHPEEFVDYMRYITSINPNTAFNVHFKYIFFNHPMDNEYQNTFFVRGNEMRELI